MFCEKFEVYHSKSAANRSVVDHKSGKVEKKECTPLDANEMDTVSYVCRKITGLKILTADK